MHNLSKETNLFGKIDSMLSVDFIRSNLDFVKTATKNKNRSVDFDKILSLDEEVRGLQQKLQTLQAERNKLAKEKFSEENRLKGLKLKESINEIESKLAPLQKLLEEILQEVPNPAFSDVPVGKNDEENVEVKKWGEMPKFDFEPLDHLTLGERLGILDFERGAKVAGAQTYYLLGMGAMLEIALINYALQKLSSAGFLPVITPDFAKSRYYLGTGYAPVGEEAQTYKIEGEDLGLVATSEVTLAGRHADEILTEKELPICYAGYSHCFRQEAGAYGKYSKGLYRVHQFSKVEMFVYCLPEESEKWHQKILAIEEEILQELGIPYRVLEMCTGDLGAMAARKYDLEAWMPGRKGFGEVTSTSNCTDFQARNLNIRYKKNDGEKGYIHMLNGTAVALSRTPIAILENFQQKDGSVVIPSVLRPFMGGLTEIKIRG